MRKADLLMLLGTMGANALLSYLIVSRVPASSGGSSVPTNSVPSNVVAHVSMIDEAYGFFTTARFAWPRRDAVQVGGGVYYLGERCPFGLLIQIRPDALLCESMGRLRIVWRTCDPYLAHGDADDGGQESEAVGSESSEGS